MRVLHVLHNSLPLLCGYSLRSAAILREQQRLGIHPTVVTSERQPRSDGKGSESIDGITYFRTPPADTFPFPVLRERAIMRGLERRIHEVIGLTRPDLIHAHSPVLVGLPALRAARDHGLPFVYEVRDLWENASVDRGKFGPHSPFYQLARRVETDVLRGADAVVTICEALRRELEPRVTNKSRLSVVENGVDVQQFSLGSHHTGSPADTSATGGVMAYVGTFQPYEGLDVLVRSLPTIIAARPDVQLLIVGAAAGDNHDVENGLRALIGALGVERHVTFTGRLPHADVAGIYARTDVVVYPRLLTRTTALTTPLKPLEAMAMGCAVVGSDVPAMTEIVRHDETGLTFPAGQPEALASVCLALLANPERRRTLARQARAWVVQERQWSRLVEKYAAIYAPLVEATSFPDALSA